MSKPNYSDYASNSNGYVSPDGLWSAIPYGKKYMILYNGEQMTIHTTLDVAKRTIAKYKKTK